MFLSDWLASRPAWLLTLTLAHFLWQGALIAALLHLAVTLSRLRAARARYAASLVAFAVMCAAPCITFAWLMSQGGAPALLQPVHGAFELPPVAVAIGDHALHSPAAWLRVFQPMALALWITGVLLLALRLSVGACGIARLRQTRQSLPAELAARVEKLIERLALPNQPFVFQSAQITEAMALGIFRPFVLIPAAWISEMPVELLEAVVAHELSHLRRHDLVINLLQRLAETLLFYHPAVWWLSRRLRIERELCADELAVAATGERLLYAQALERVAAWRQVSVRPALAAFLRGEENMRLLERVQTVLGMNPGEPSRLWPAGLVTLALPLALWAASLGLFGPLSQTVAADDDDRKPTVRRERDDDDRPVKREGEDRSLDELLGTVKQLINKQLSSRQIVEEELNKKESDERKMERKPIKREVVEVEVKEKPSIDKPVPVRKRVEAVSDLKGDDRCFDELLGMVKQLSARVERLQDEVANLRSEKRGSDSAPASPAKIRTKPSADRSSLEPAEAEKLARVAESRRDQEIKERAILGKLRAGELKNEAIKDKSAADIKGDAEAIAQKIRALVELKGLDALKSGELKDLGALNSFGLKDLEALKSAGAEAKKWRAETEKLQAEAQKQRVEAQKQRAEAEAQRARAEQRADKSRDIAERAREQAEEAVAKALEQKKEALVKEIEKKLPQKKPTKKDDDDDRDDDPERS